ncbi:hypothetical protein G5B41_17550 [bacterium SGD-2]|nr:hypothetical protein [bacterium SGD-2]
MRKRRKTIRQNRVRLPVTGLRDMIAIQMHANVAGIEAGSLESFDSLAQLVNMVGYTIFRDGRFEHENRLMRGGAMALNEVGRLLESGLKPKSHHLATIRSLVSMFDELLPRLDVMRLYTAEKIVNQTPEIQQAALAAMMKQRNETCKSE